MTKTQHIYERNEKRKHGPRRIQTKPGEGSPKGVREAFSQAGSSDSAAGPSKQVYPGQKQLALLKLGHRRGRHAASDVKQKKKQQRYLLRIELGQSGAYFDLLIQIIQRRNAGHKPYYMEWEALAPALDCWHYCSQRDGHVTALP